MKMVEAGRIRHIVQFRQQVKYNPIEDTYTIVIKDLDSDLYEAWNQFCNDVACHVLEQLTVDGRRG